MEDCDATIDEGASADAGAGANEYENGYMASSRLRELDALARTWNGRGPGDTMFSIAPFGAEVWLEVARGNLVFDRSDADHVFLRVAPALTDAVERRASGSAEYEQGFRDAEFDARVARAHARAESRAMHSGPGVLSVLGSEVVLSLALSGRGPMPPGPVATTDLAWVIAEVESGPMRTSRTVHLMETVEGPTVVTGGASDLSAAQILEAERLGLTPAAPMPGEHAEITGLLNPPTASMFTPIRGTTTNIICDGNPWSCGAAIRGMGGVLTGPRSYEFPFVDLSPSGAVVDPAGLLVWDVTAWE
jgi:hypothetical protein